MPVGSSAQNVFQPASATKQFQKRKQNTGINQSYVREGQVFQSNPGFNAFRPPHSTGTYQQQAVGRQKTVQQNLGFKQLEPPSAFKKLQPPSAYKQLQPPSAYKQLQPPSAYKQLQPSSAFKKSQPPSAYKQLQPSSAFKQLLLEYLIAKKIATFWSTNKSVSPASYS